MAAAQKEKVNLKKVFDEISLKTTYPVLIAKNQFVYKNEQLLIEIGTEESKLVINLANDAYGKKVAIVPSLQPSKTKDEFAAGEVLVATLASFDSIESIKDNETETYVIIFTGIEKVLVQREVKDGVANTSNLALTSIAPDTNKDLVAQQSAYKNVTEVLEFDDDTQTIIEEHFKKDGLNGITDYFLRTQIKANQKIWEIYNNLDSVDRLNQTIEIIKVDIELSEKEDSSDIDKKISNKIKSKLNDQQREYYLREKLKAIKDELNELNGMEDEVEELRRRLDENPYPDYIKTKVKKELSKLENTPSQAAEASVIKNYVDWLLDLPYWQRDPENIEIKKAKKLLDQEHYGLEKVKERIIEYLAVRQMKKDSPNTGSILALVGPPGVGKTSLSKSIAKALDRKFVKISLGGIRDEAEIRGHRRTYIGAMPGKIISAMKKAGVINPVILLDEVDKLSSDYKGDPTSALLEVLDYEQNKSFQDHYIEEDYDLSNVMFITTANYYDHIPRPLLDRLEIIELSSYTELEKVSIAKEYLFQEVVDAIGINPKEFTLNDEVIKFLIQHYTMEAGVRGLRRVLEQLGRKILVKKIEGELKGEVKVTKELILKMLGKEKTDYTRRLKKDSVGTVTGLAWTEAGGDILPIEVTLYKGEGKVVITGSLKDVMKESATIALGYIKANHEMFGIAAEDFKNYDVHIHCPDGATPKDGPSAGITFTTAIISAFTKKAVSGLIGMTGEITLRGLVFPIGGLREKSISAFRSGLKSILIPIENKKDLDEVPQEVKDKLEIIPVEHYSQVFNYIFNGIMPVNEEDGGKDVKAKKAKAPAKPKEEPTPKIKKTPSIDKGIKDRISPKA